MSIKTTSHDYARRLQEQAAFLLSKPEFATSSKPTCYFWFYGDKEGFLGAVKAVGTGKKKYKGDDVDFVPNGFDDILISANRNTVCRKVQEEKWECEPLLSQAEESELESAQ